MRKDFCQKCNGSGEQLFCSEHQSRPGFNCECFACVECQGYGKLRVKISNEELAALTLKVTQVLFESGVEDAKYNESNNLLRHDLKEFLVDFCGYEVDRQADWQHTNWIELRRQLKMSDPFNALK